MGTPPNALGNLKEKILRAIAMAYPFSPEEVKATYDWLKSYDALISLCERAVQNGLATMQLPESLTELDKAKVFVVWDPLYEEVVSAHRTEKGAQVRCDQKDKEPRHGYIRGGHHHSYDEYEVED